MAEQIRALTGLRAFAALLVLLLHYNQAFNGFDFQALLPFIAYGHIGVDVFFVLSGYILAHVYGTRLASYDAAQAVRFIVLRVARIWPTHLFGLATILVLYLIARSMGYGFNDPENWRFAHLPFHVTMTQAWFMNDIALWNAPSWSISAEFFAYLCMPLGLPLLLRPGVAAVTVVAAVAGIVLTYGVVGIDLATAYKGWPAIARVSTEFWLGAATYVLVRAAPEHAGYRLLPPLCIGLILVAILVDIPDWWLILCVPPLLIGLDKGGNAVFASRPLVYLGTVSYSVYIMHFPVQLALMQAYGFLGAKAWSLPLQILWYLAAMAVAVAVGMAAFHLVEHPARALIRQRLRMSPAT